MARMFAISPRQEAEALADANYEALKEVVLRSVRSRLFSRSVRLDRIDLEEAYNLAWHGVCQAIAQGRRVGNLAGLLVDITGKRAIDIYRQRNEAMFAEADVETRAVELDLAERVDDRQKIDHLLERLKDRLSDVQRNAVTLCLLHGYTRPEAARLLGIEPVAFEKVMDRATKKISGVVAAMDGRGCGDDEWARALRSFALGVIGEDSPDYERVAAHVRECVSCERYVVGLRGLAAVLPPLGLPLVPAGRDAGDLLAHLHRLFAPHGAAAGAAGAQTTATLASSTAAGSAAAAGGGGWTLAGSGVAKVAAVAGLAAAGALSVHALVIRQPTRQRRSASIGRPADRRSSGWRAHADKSAGTGVGGALFRRAQGVSSVQGRPANGGRQSGRRIVPTPQSAAAAEFGLEGARVQARAPVSVPRAAPIAQKATASAESAPASRPVRSESTEPREFSFER